MMISEFQKLIYDQYFEKDNGRGVEGTFLWFVEEVGELARAIKNDDEANLREEFADVLAWLTSLASIKGVDLEAAAAAKYGAGCPRCAATPCACPPRSWEQG
jgi:NTP pyrophosphatase (non-canonical NTP hydrolase)